MTRSSCSVLALVLLASDVRAADFWTSRPWAEWSEKEVQTLLTNSPWAAPIPMQLKSTEARDAGAYKAGVTADSRFGATADTQFAKTTLNLVWNGRTVRKAQVRQRKLKGEAPDAEKDNAFIEGPDKESYVLVLQAPNFPALPEATVEQLQAAAKLAVGKKKSARVLQPSRVEKPEAAKGSVAVFFFARGDKPIEAAEGEATFTVTIGDYEVSRGFDLEDMVVDGALDI